MFHFCPQCKEATPRFIDKKLYRCDACGLEFFQNVAAAVGVVIQFERKVILLERAKEPCAGYFDLPGGFNEVGETAEQAIRRETREETGLELDQLAYFTSFANEYEYRGFTYSTCDIFFHSPVASLSGMAPCRDEVKNILLLSPSDIDFDRVAFASARHALKKFSDEL